MPADIALGVTCKGLKKADLLSKSDPFAVLFILDDGANKGWVEQGRTETIKNNLDPVFKLAFRVRFYFDSVLLWLLIAPNKRVGQAIGPLGERSHG